MAIKRTKEHQIDDAGETLLKQTLNPLNWAVNKTEEDYAVDFNVQIFDGESPNGKWIHIQLKSSESPDYSAARDFISYSLRLDHARHFALELQQPVFLMVADVTENKLFWTCPQLDRQLIEQLGKKIDQESITIRIPTKQRLPDTFDALLESLNSAYIVTFSRGLASISTSDFAESLDYCVDKSKQHVSMQEKNDILKLDRIVSLINEGTSRRRGNERN